MPVATAVLAIAGAFATTSMQSASSAFAPKIGYLLQADGSCSDIAVMCSDIPTQTCRFVYPNGPLVFNKDPATGNCTTLLGRPQ